MVQTIITKVTLTNIDAPVAYSVHGPRPPAPPPPTHTHLCTSAALRGTAVPPPARLPNT